MDREKVIKELEILRDICNAKSTMAIGKGKIAWAGYANTADDAINLLKEQEAVKVQYTAMGGLRYGVCPQCDARIDNLVNPKACGFCGQELKWE